MTVYVLRRLALGIPTLLGVSVVVFLLIRLVPGDVVDVMIGANPDPTGQQAAELRRVFGLDRPLPIQYLDWVGGVLRGDFGHSLRTGRPILSDILARLPVTIELAIVSASWAIVVGVPAGIVAAVARRSIAEFVAQIVGLVGLSIPGFWLATMLVLAAAGWFGWFGGAKYVSFFENPVENLKIFALPSLAVGLGLAASLTRYTRSAMLDVLGRDFIRTARAKGLAETRVVGRHALRNALIPIVTVIGLQVGYLLGGVVIVETVFAMPGLGRLVLDAINQRDYPMVQAVVMVLTLTTVASNLAVDVAYAYIDPRIRYR